MAQQKHRVDPERPTSILDLPPELIQRIANCLLPHGGYVQLNYDTDPFNFATYNTESSDIISLTSTCRRLHTSIKLPELRAMITTHRDVSARYWKEVAPLRLLHSLT